MDLTIKKRLMILVALMSVLTMTVVGYGLFSLKQTNQGMKTIYADRAIPLAQLGKIRYNLLHVRVALVTAIYYPNEATGQLKKIQNNVSEIEQLWDAYTQTYLVPEEKELVNQFQNLHADFNNRLNHVLSLLSAGENENAKNFYFVEVRKAYEPVSAITLKLIQLQEEVAKQEYQAATSRFQFAFFMLAGLSLIGLSFCIFISIRIIKHLIRELGGEPNYAASIVKQISKGNFSIPIDLEKGDNSSLLYSISKMREALNNTIIGINITMDEISQGILSSRIQGEFQGDFAKIKSGMNGSLDTISDTLIDVMRVTEAISRGDLTQKMTGSYKGAFDKTKISVNHTVDELLRLTNEIQEIVYSGAECGDFSVKMTVNNKEGFSKELAILLNQLFATTEKSLRDIQKIAESMADGDLTKTITDDYVGAFATTKVGINTTVSNLQGLIAQIKTTGDVIASASKEISEENRELAKRTENQAANVEETAAAMQQLTETIKENTNNAEQANDLACIASKTAQEGVSVVSSVVNTMSSINESSHRIVDIVSVIDDIAFQTNILALNAAVEAARAGEQGKGFAVVATEVRNLAQRAANAANEVKNLIHESVARVNGGSQQVEKAGQAMENIVDAIRQVTSIISSISKASIEQNAGISLIHNAMVSLDEVTQQNATLVEEVAAAADSLSNQTKVLSTEMACFKTKQSDGTSTENISPRQAQTMQQKDNAIIVDVREQDEWDSGHISGALHIPLKELPSRSSELNAYKDKQLILQCRSGGRSAKALGILKQKGFKMLYNMDGGLNSWTLLGLPLTI